MKEVIYWDGPGWYGSREEGAYENVHIVTIWCGGDPDVQPDSVASGVGTPRWFDSEEEIEERNPEAQFIKRD